MKNNTFIFLLLLITQTSYASSCKIIDSYNKANLAEQIGSNISRPPAPSESLRTQGLLPNNPLFISSIQSKADLKIMQNAAIAYKAGVSQDKSLSIAKKYMTAWVDTYKPNYNPIDEADFALLIDSYGLIRHTFTESEQGAINKYLMNWATGYIESMKDKPKNGTWINNWNSYRVRFIVMTAFLLENDSLIKSAKKVYVEQINNNIDSNGETVDFKQRDAITYVIYDLHPLLDSALIAKINGQDWFNLTSESNSSLAKAVDWLIPYVDGTKTHIEFSKTKIKFDLYRANYGLKGYFVQFNPSDASPIFWKASAFNSKYQSIASKLSTKRRNNITLCW